MELTDPKVCIPCSWQVASFPSKPVMSSCLLFGIGEVYSKPFKLLPPFLCILLNWHTLLSYYCNMGKRGDLVLDIIMSDILNTLESAALT